MSLPLTTREVPFFKLLIPLLGGILIEHYFPVTNNLRPIYSCLAFSTILVFIAYFFSNTWSYRWIFGLSLYPLLFLLGIAITIPQKGILDSEKPLKLVIRLLDDPSKREKSYRSTAEVYLINKDGSWKQSKDKLLVYFKNDDSLASNLKYGSLIATEVKPNEIPRPKNPNQFDYSKYLSNKGIYYSATIQPNRWILLGHKGSKIKSTANKLSRKLIELFETSGLTGDELAVASALTIGYKDLLDEEIKKVYSDSGTMHILAVSGMHVAILYYLFSFMLIFMNKNKTLRILKALTLLCFLWFFAIITGLSPSVQRAALMFSFIVIGDSLSRKITVYNSLAASAFILLLMNPNNFFDTGFQLSYIAVLSIVFFHPLINKLLAPRNVIVSYAWSLIAVSIAAQIGTFGLTLFYFNQFPNLFLLSNLIAIPISTVAMYLSIILIIVSPIHFLATAFGKLFSLSLWLLNNSLKFIEEIPGSVTNGLYIDGIQLVLILTIVTFMVIYFAKKQNLWLFILLSLIVLLQTSLLAHKIGNLKKKQMVVFSIPNCAMISLKDGPKMTIYTDDSTNFNPENKYGFYIKPYLCSNGNAGRYKLIQPTIQPKKDSQQLNPKTDYYFFTFNGLTAALVYGKSLESMRSDYPLKLDLIILSKAYPNNIFKLFEPKQVVLATNIERWRLDKLKNECSKRGFDLYIAPEQGAYIHSQ